MHVAFKFHRCDLHSPMGATELTRHEFQPWRNGSYLYGSSPAGVSSVPPLLSCNWSNDNCSAKGSTSAHAHQIATRPAQVTRVA